MFAEVMKWKRFFENLEHYTKWKSEKFGGSVCCEVISIGGGRRRTMAGFCEYGNVLSSFIRGEGIL
jgi:hypothetical protein